MSTLATSNRALHIVGDNTQHYLILFAGKLSLKRRNKANSLLLEIRDDFNPGNTWSKDVDAVVVCDTLHNVTVFEDEWGTFNISSEGYGSYGIPPENLKYRVV